MTEATAKNLFSRFVELIINELFTARSFSRIVCIIVSCDRSWRTSGGKLDIKALIEKFHYFEDNGKFGSVFADVEWCKRIFTRVAAVIVA